MEMQGDYQSHKIHPLWIKEIPVQNFIAIHPNVELRYFTSPELINKLTIAIPGATLAKIS